MAKAILFVDDEKSILNSLKREFIGEGLDFFLASSGEEGLAILGREKIDIVVSDVKMPFMDGLKFLSIVKNKHPQVYRLILSGYVEESSVIGSLIAGTASTYISKPWDSAVLKKKIEQIFKTLDLLKNKDILDLVGSMEKLPAISNIYNQVLGAIYSEKSPLDIENILQQDPILCTKILQVANSAFLSSSKICSIKRCIVLLGCNVIKDIVLTTSLVDQLSWDDQQIRELHRISRHSSLVNAVFTYYYRWKVKKNPPLSASSIGITHDLGKIILLQFFRENYFKTKERCDANPEKSFYQVEQELGLSSTNHALVGGYFLNLWNLPDLNVDIALFHHQPDEALDEDQEIISIFSMVNRVVNLVTAKQEERLPKDYEIKLKGFQDEDINAIEEKLSEDVMS